MAGHLTALALRGALLGATGFALSGCLGSPTYGTGTPSDVQLLEDITGIIAVTPKQEEQIEYKPRPELVKPAEMASLPAPQDGIATSSNAAWPESPEERRRRIRADATERRDDPDFVPAVSGARVASAPAVRHTRGDSVPADGSPVSSGNTASQRAEFNRRLAMSKQGSPTTRRFLSEPPLAYREPAETAPANDVGEDEWKKERRQKSAARKKGTGTGWRDWMPF